MFKCLVGLFSLSLCLVLFSACNSDNLSSNQNQSSTADISKQSASSESTKSADSAVGEIAKKTDVKSESGKLDVTSQVFNTSGSISQDPTNSSSSSLTQKLQATIGELNTVAAEKRKYAFEISQTNPKIAEVSKSQIESSQKMRDAINAKIAAHSKEGAALVKREKELGENLISISEKLRKVKPEERQAVFDERKKITDELTIVRSDKAKIERDIRADLVDVREEYRNAATKLAGDYDKLIAESGEQGAKLVNSEKALMEKMEQLKVELSRQRQGVITSEQASQTAITTQE